MSSLLLRFDDMISDVLTERGSLQHLRFLICMLRHFFTLSQKSLFITLALGDFNRKHAKIFVQTMRTQEIEAEGEHSPNALRRYLCIRCLPKCDRPGLDRYWGNIPYIDSVVTVVPVVRYACSFSKTGAKENDQQKSRGNAREY